MKQAEESELAKDEEGDQTFEAGKPAPAPSTAPNAKPAPATGNGTGTPETEGTKRKADQKEGIDGDAKKAKA